MRKKFRCGALFTLVLKDISHENQRSLLKLLLIQIMS